ncbi:SAM-dependent methyltransferase [Virgisporangium aurantiacum]|uniref:SAM-dependent methyltransferase n=1 Tax=Virgisporangium aurantiacum TaxID=175570 RepID=UPI00194FDA19|nr:SAM-dependent methyltransferase [Virgisporangium aurantiacum]
MADTNEASAIVKRLVDALSPGSYVVVNDGANTNQAGVEAAEVRGEAGDPYTLRSPEQIARFLDGLQLVEPGVVSTPRWRPDPDDEPVDLGVFCGVAQKV